MTLKKTSIWTDTNNGTHGSYKAAQDAQKVIDRTARVAALLYANGAQLATDLAGGTDADEVASVIANAGDDFLAALTLPSTRGPKVKSA